MEIALDIRIPLPSSLRSKSAAKSMTAAEGTVRKRRPVCRRGLPKTRTNLLGSPLSQAGFEKTSIQRQEAGPQSSLSFCQGLRDAPSAAPFWIGLAPRRL